MMSLELMLSPSGFGQLNLLEYCNPSQAAAIQETTKLPPSLAPI